MTSVLFNRRMRKTACPVVWEPGRVKIPSGRPDQLMPRRVLSNAARAPQPPWRDGGASRLPWLTLPPGGGVCGPERESRGGRLEPT